MKACLSYSLFGYERARHKDCYDFNSYLRYFTLVLRMNKLLYKGFDNVLNIDNQTYNSEYKGIFDRLQTSGLIKINICPDNTLLCKAMLWRLKPAFTNEYDYVFCRDIDSLECYKGRACVEHFIKNGTKTVHCITDSVSHNIAMMGGMVGVHCNNFKSRVKSETWDGMINNDRRNYQHKGSDQDFLNQYVLPRVADSMMEHYFQGMPQSFRGDCYTGINIVDNVIVEGLPVDLKETNHLVNHIGQAGFILEPVLKYYYDNGLLYGDIWDIEKDYSDIFIWTKNK